MVQIELLLKEGLWQECIEIFPAPTGKLPELDMLINMWVEVEKNSPAALPTLIPVVEKYLKRFYTDWQHQAFEKVLDQVQRSAPNAIAGLCTTGSEVMLVNLTQSRYKEYVSFVKDMKKRLYSINKKKDWEELFRMQEGPQKERRN